jgi:hypothetical protein
MKNLKIIVLLAAPLSLLTPHILLADCPFAHTHIGINPTARPDWSDPGNRSLDTDSDPTDDDKLWFFSLPPVHPAGTPGWPEWSDADGSPFLLLKPDLDPFGNPQLKPGDPSKMRYTCEFKYSAVHGYDDPNGFVHLDGWHSAHGPGGMWSLSSIDQATVPQWDLKLVRMGSSIAEDDFFMEDGGIRYLSTDGSEYDLGKQWLEDKNAWGLHDHMSFNFYLAADGSDEGSVATSTFSVYDAGGLYQSSDNFEFRFAVVPEPANLMLMVFGSCFLLKRTRCKHIAREK